MTWAFTLGATFAGTGFTFTPLLSADDLLDAAYEDPLSWYRPYGPLAPDRSSASVSAWGSDAVGPIHRRFSEPDGGDAVHCGASVAQLVRAADS